jgi:hypothetical protein
MSAHSIARFTPGTVARIDQGFGLFTEVIVVAFTTEPNSLGGRKNYNVKVTGGVNVFGKPAKVGAIQLVSAGNVVLA